MVGAITNTGIRKNGSDYVEGVFLKPQIMEKIVGEAYDAATITPAHTDTPYPTLGNAVLSVAIHAHDENYAGGESIEAKLYKREVIDEDIVFSLLDTITVTTPAITAGSVSYINITNSLGRATHYTLSGTFTAPSSGSIKVIAETISNSTDAGSQTIVSTTDSEWVVVNKEGSVTLDCDANATCAGYVEVKTGPNAAAEIWDAGTITNSVAHAQFGLIYAIRFVVTASTGHIMTVIV